MRKLTLMLVLIGTALSGCIAPQHLSAAGPPIKNKALVKVNATNMPSFCAQMTAPDCSGFTGGTMIAVACLFADGSCGAASVPIDLVGGLFGPSKTLTGAGSVTAGKNTCLFAANLGQVGTSMGTLGYMPPATFAFSCSAQ